MEVTKSRQQLSKLKHVHRADHVHVQRELALNGEIVNRRKMKHCRRLFAHFSGIEWRHPQLRMGYVAFDDLKLLNRLSAETRDSRNFLARSRDECRLDQQ
jgi:hypothetical protein